MPALDGLRGAAALMVFFLHYGGGARSHNPVVHAIGELEKAGGSGVTLFFVLSGFLITGILWDGKGAAHWWRNFYARRVLRILPLYYGALLLVLAVAVFTGDFLHDLGRIGVTALYLQTFPAMTVPPWTLRTPLSLVHFGTLAVEEQFYLVWPLVLYLVRGRRAMMGICAGLFTASLLYRLDSGAVNSLLVGNWLLLARSGEFAAGAWLALAFRGPEWGRVRAWIAPVGAVFGVLFLMYGWRAGFVMATPRDFAYSVGAATVFYMCLVGLVLQPGAVSWAASTGWLRWTGQISYGIYVYHLLFRRAFDWLAAQLTGATEGNRFLLVRLGVALAGTLAVASLSYYGYERRFLRLKRYFPKSAEVPDA